MMWPDVEWVDQRWAIEDGHLDGAVIWTAGGAGCGEFLFLILFVDDEACYELPHSITSLRLTMSQVALLTGFEVGVLQDQCISNR